MVQERALSGALLRQAAQEYIKYQRIGRPLASKTVQNRRVFVRTLLRFIENHELNEQSAREFVLSRQEARKALGTTATDVKNIRSFINFLFKTKYLKENFAEEIERPRMPKQHRSFLTPLEYEQVIYAGTQVSESDHIRHRKQKAITRWALLFTLSTGCRIQETLKLSGDDIAASVEKVEVTFHRKAGGTDVKEVVNAQVAKYLREHAKAGKKKVFPCSQELMRRCLKRGAVKLGISSKFEMTVHSLRHSFATDLLRNGCSLAQVSRSLGHTNTKITYETYSHLDSSDIAQSERTYGSLNKRDATPEELRKILLETLNRQGFVNSGKLEIKTGIDGTLELKL